MGAGSCLCMYNIGFSASPNGSLFDAFGSTLAGYSARKACHMAGRSFMNVTEESDKPLKVLLWEQGSLGRKAIKERVKRSPAHITGLKSSTVYLISVRAHNSGGVGPTSAAINMTTKKPPPSQPPVNIGWTLKNSKIFLHWQHVMAMDNESEVTGYKLKESQLALESAKGASSVFCALDKFKA
ncbi:contactin-4 [Tachysurus ichikawai]